MKFMLVLVLAAACHAELARSKQKEDSRERRADSAVEKRAPAVLPTPLPSTPGIEYADKESPTEKTPAQQVYSRAEPQVAKISDVLTGHGPPFPAAIASHLFSPVPVYQPRLSSPTTYEISAPIPSQLAYSEHKISYQPQQNAIQYTPQEYNHKLANPKQAIARLTVNYQPYPQQLLVQPQPLVYQQQPQQILQQLPVYQQGYQQGYQQPIQYSQAPQIYQPNQQAYTQQPVIQLVRVQPGITYATQEETNDEQTHQRPAQRELKTGQPEAVKELEKNAQPQQNYNAQPQGAVSYASFSQGLPAPSFAQPQRQQHQPQQQPQQQYQQPQQPQQFQQPQQPQQYQQPQSPQQYQQPQQPQYQQVQYQQPQIQYQAPQYQVPQYQPAPQRQVISKPEPNLIAIPVKPNRLYFRQGPSIQQPQVYQPYQGQETPGQQPAPSFLPVQYFGKFAQSIFGQYQQQ